MPRHLLDIRDLSTQELDALMDRADDIIQNPKRYARMYAGEKAGDALLRAQHPHAPQL